MGDKINLGVPASSGFENVTNLQFSGIIAASIQILLVVASVIFFFLLIGGGLAVITSGGQNNPQQAQRGRSAVSSAIIGLIIVFGAWGIIQLLEVFFGVSILGGLSLIGSTL